ncbi:MAG: hypothetical protein KF773_04785 [Deltaproteobacteria bacterium]|nr:hypothetical protein [Deltaproteobacteria bacterium]
MYRMYALDEVGKVLDYVVTVDTRETRELLRNAGAEPSLLPAVRTSAVPSSDLRFALETMGQMMRANSEALRAVTEAQAGWVKSIASTRGFFRNGSMPTPMPMPEATRVEEDEGDDDAEPVQGKTIFDVLAPLAEHWAPSVKSLMSMLAEGAGAKALVTGATRPGLELRELVDLRYAAEKGTARREAKQTAATKSSLKARVVADPNLMAHFLAIKELHEPEEAEKILALGERISEEQQDWLLAQVSAVNPAEAAAVLRTMLAELSAVKVSMDSVE